MKGDIKNSKNLIVKILLVFVLVFSIVGFGSFASTASEATENEAFTITNGVLTAYHGTDENVIIPEGVLEIGNRAFADCTSLKSVTFPSTLTSIGVYAFGNTGLQEVVLPENLKILKNNVFEKKKAIWSNYKHLKQPT